jgi:hypothetical protein
METSTRIIDYPLKGCMVEQKCKNNIPGRSHHHSLRGHGLFVHLE